MVRQGSQALRLVVSGLGIPLMLSGCLMNDPIESSAQVVALPGSESNVPPEISGTPPAVIRVGVAYTFTPVAIDSNGDSLSFSINNKPDWLTFDSAIGQIFGVPFLGSEGTYDDIDITVSDGSMSATLPTFAITVEPNIAPNLAPEIGGTPAGNIVVGQSYSFTPTSSDPDGDNLTFSIQNMPGWAQFNASTGELSGTPQVGDAGSYANISISVNDGTVSSTLPEFNITVDQIGLGSATLSWTPPTQNTDGSNLDNLDGFKIYYGTSLGNYSFQITIDNPGIATYVVDDLAPGTWYFVSTAFNTVGVESSFSNMASKTIN